MLTQQLAGTNGVDVDRLKSTVQAVQENAELAKFVFRARNKWLERGRNRSTIKEFYGAGQEDRTRTSPYVLDNDEPEILLGEDQAPNPVEYILHALAGCLTTTMVFHAASRGIEIESLESSLDGDIDIRGMLGVSNEVPRGYKAIRVKLRVKSEAPPEKLAELAKFSPVYNTLTQPVPVELTIEKV